MNIEVKNSQKAVDYTESMKILEQRVDDVLSGKKKELLWVLEHKNVYTAGTSANKFDQIDKKIKVIKTNRGGKHTYHGEGQKVVYFVLNLNKREKNIRKLLNNIEECIVSVLKDYGIKSHPDRKNIGIWIKKNNELYKIAAIGIKVRKWIAYHGFAINVSNDLTKYNAIIPCGIKNRKITSLNVLGIKKYKEINNVIIARFLNTFL
jgi:lipoyl(octanoyl) transferase